MILSLVFHTTFNIPKGISNIAITGCIVCPDGRLVFVDYNYNSKLVILNGDRTLHTEITCSPSKPFDVTCLDDTTVAVSTIYGIEIIDINSTKTKRRIKISKLCGGITYHNGVLLWCEHQRGIQMMKLSDDRVTTLAKQTHT
jgi:hypothetical protein